MFYQTIITLLTILGGIIFVDLILSGDNALVIGAVAASIPSSQRRTALIWGSIGAIILRIVFTIFATFLLSLNFLQAIGGILVLFIATRLLMEEDDDKDKQSEEQLDNVEEENIRKLPKTAQWFSKSMKRLLGTRLSPVTSRFIMAALTITIADLTMSLDNVVAIAALAKGQILLLGIGLLLSIIILFISSALIARLIKRLPALIIVAALILAWVSGNLILNYVKTLSFLTTINPLYYNIPIYVITFGVVLCVAFFTRWSRRKEIFSYYKIK